MPDAPAPADEARATATPSPPLVQVDLSSAKAVWGTVMGALLLVVTSFPTLLALLRGHDLVAVIRWAQGSDGVALFGAVGFLATIAWRVSSSVGRHFNLVIAARSADDSVAVVRGDSVADASIKSAGQ